MGSYDRTLFKTGYEVPCPVCGKKLYRPLSLIKQGRKYCSRKCYGIAHNPVMVVKQCRVCKHLFEVSKAISNRFTCCSFKCRTAHHYTYFCRGCGKFFRSVEERWEQKFCSLSCLRRTKHETAPEAKVKQMLNELNVAFVQELRLGRYSIDFAIVDRKIAIEVDGEYWHRNTQRDARKQDYIIANGWRLIRLPEIEVYNMDGNSLKIKLDESQHTPTVGVGI